MKYLKTTYTENLPFHTLNSLRERLEWFISLRWIAVLCLFLSIPFGREMLKFRIGFNEIILLISLLAVINIVYTFLVNHLRFKNEYQELAFAEIQIVVDLIFISFIIHFSGGIGNPFYFFYIVLVILSGILFPGKILPYVNAFFAAFLLTFWTIMEHLFFVDRYLLIEDSISGSLIITSLFAFYLTNFAGIYIINNFMSGYISIKKIIDEKNIQLEKSMKDRNKAFRYAAHELKSPVIAIQSNLGVIKSLFSDDLKMEVKEMVLKAERRSNQIIDMIKELIMITQYNLGIEKPHFETVNFDEWLFNIVSSSSADAKAKNISLEYEKFPDPIIVTIDTNGLEKVVTNVLNNALRYTPEFRVVKVAVLKNANSFGFSVSDTGIGIPKEDLQKIFDEFYRSKNAREAVQIGTGLGLNLVKEIIEQLGGNIEVESELGKGSTFKVNLPSDHSLSVQSHRSD